MNIATKVEKEAKPPVFSDELNDSVPSGRQHEETTVTASKQRVTAPSAKDIEAKIAYMASKPGLRSKVDANCMYCSYDPLDVGGWRQQVESCNVTKCPLHSVRPRSSSKK